MKTVVLAAVTMMCGGFSAHAQLMLTGILDGDLAGGTPKAIELFANESIADLSQYGFENAANGAASTGAPDFIFTGSAQTGSYLYVGNSRNGTSLTSFGIAENTGAADTDTPWFSNSTAIGSPAAINGNDAIILYKYDSDLSVWNVIDTYGNPGEDGTGTAWEYTNGWAYRNDGTTPAGDGSFVQADWDVHTGGLDGVATIEDTVNTLQASGAFPNFVAVPEPRDYALATGMGLLLFLLYRRRVLS